MGPPPPTSPLFPYTTLFRSRVSLRTLGLLVPPPYMQAFADRHRSIVDRLQRLEDVDRKSTRLNSSHLGISYAVFCLKKKTRQARDGGDTPRSDRLRAHEVRD